MATTSWRADDSLDLEAGVGRASAAPCEGPSTAPRSPSEAAPAWSAAPVGSLAHRLWNEGHAFDFFQAVRLLEKSQPHREPVGQGGPPATEIVRFRCHSSLNFPASAIYEIEAPRPEQPLPTMAITFLGLTGTCGVLPRHYTEALQRLHREARFSERYALRDWLDQFHHRLTSLFYRAWEKYRFYLAFERDAHAQPEPDAFTRALLSLVGLGLPALRRRLRIDATPNQEETPARPPLAQVDDLSILHYGGLFAHRPRNVAGLEGLLSDHFQLPVRVRQFQGQWLKFDLDNQSRLGHEEGNSRLGSSLVLGERVWNVQGKIRVRLGPLNYRQFVEFLPDRRNVPERKLLFLLVQLVHLYAGPELDVDVQLVLRAPEVPPWRLSRQDPIGSRLGWNTWCTSHAPQRDVEDAVFSGEK